MNTLFPVFLKTETAQFLVVGGGKIGLEKTETLHTSTLLKITDILLLSSEIEIILSVSSTISFGFIISLFLSF